MNTAGRPLVYQCGAYRIDLIRREVSASDEIIPLGVRAFEVLQALVVRAPQLVTKDELMQAIWPGAPVEENTLQVQVSAVRRALGRERGMLRTESGRGYRLLGDWTPIEAGQPYSANRPAPPLERTEPPRKNLPPATSRLIGRAGAIEHISQLLAAYRLVTLTGPGGIGKTALAGEVMQTVLPDFASEGWIVELAAIADPDLVPSAVARAAGLKRSGGETSAENIARAIGRRRMLLVLDNCEHVVDAAATLADAILRLCPGATMLATSREVLRVAGEQTYRVPPLELPSASPNGCLDGSAAELFVERIRAWNSEFLPESGDVQSIATICRDLDGIPLAIEFAAAAAATLGVGQVAAGLTDRFSLLKMGRRTALPRHQTLRAALDWSYDLLPEQQAVTLRRLAIFAGGYSPHVAGAAAPAVRGTAVAGMVADLVAKSLVAVEFSGGVPIYQLLDTIRHYAWEKLTFHQEYEQAARSHAEYFRALALRAEAESETLPEADWLARYGQHLDNWRAALDWAFSSKDDEELGLMVTLCAVPIWFKLSLMAECRRRTERALLSAGEATDPRIVMRLRAVLAATLFYTDKGATPEVATAWTDVLAIADRLDDTQHRLWARWGLWNYQLNHGEFRASLVSAQRFCEFAIDPGDFATADRMLGISLHFLGDQARARQHLESVLSRPAGSPRRSMIQVQYDQKLAARAYLPRLLWLQGFPDQAAREAEAVVREAIGSGHVLATSLALIQAACPVALLTGDLLAAERYNETLYHYATTHGLGFFHAHSLCTRAILEVLHGNAAAGLEAFSAAVRDLMDYNTGMNITGFQMVMAGALLQSTEVRQGVAMADDALDRSERSGEVWCLPELRRLRGECLRRTADQGLPSAGEAMFRQALDQATQQAAPAWALRAASSLATLLHEQDRRQEARDVLRPIYESFSEGFATADLLLARQTLDLIN